MMKRIKVLLFAVAVSVCLPICADEVIIDDVIVNTALCIGDQCADGEDFGDDALRIKTNSPKIHFDDTSNSASFPKNDWTIGINDNGGAGPAQFYVSDETNSVSVILLDAGDDGGVALGANSVIEAGAISVGSPGGERRVVHVADGVDSHDAVSMSQFSAFSDNLNNNFAAELTDEGAGIDASLVDLQEKLDELTTRVNAIATELNN